MVFRGGWGQGLYDEVRLIFLLEQGTGVPVAGIWELLHVLHPSVKVLHEEDKVEQPE